MLWDSSWLLSDRSFAGRTLHTLIGYTDRPTEMQLVVYIVVIVTTFLLMRLMAPGQRGQGGRPTHAVPAE